MRTNLNPTKQCRIFNTEKVSQKLCEILIYDWARYLETVLPSTLNTNSWNRNLRNVSVSHEDQLQS